MKEDDRKPVKQGERNQLENELLFFDYSNLVFRLVLSLVVFSPLCRCFLC